MSYRTSPTQRKAYVVSLDLWYRDRFWTSLAISGCDTGWLEYNGNCYKFHLNDRRQWTGADVICQDEGGRLVTIETPSEFDWLTARLQEALDGSYIPLSGRKVWTSGTQGWMDEEWFWDDGHGTGKGLQWRNIDGLVQDCSNSSALPMELLQSCTEPSIWALWRLNPIQSFDLFIVRINKPLSK